MRALKREPLTWESYAMTRRMFLTGLAMAMACVAAGGETVETATIRAITVPSHNVELASEANGVITEVLVKEGDRVAKDQPLVQLDTKIRQASLKISEERAKSVARIASAKANLKVKKVALERQLILLKKGVASQTEVDEADFEHKYAQSLLVVAEEEKLVTGLEVERDKTILKKMTILSPLAGIVTRRIRDVGEGSHDYEPLMQIVVVDVLHVLAHVPPEMAGKLKPGTVGRLVLDDLPDSIHTCAVLVVDRVVEAASGTVRVKLELNNRDGKVAAGSKGNITFLVPTEP